jgi:heme oxygenase (biliverdin-IX-beta and delta-forming)
MAPGSDTARHVRLREVTRASRDGFVGFVQALRPFESKDRYLRLLRMQLALQARAEDAYRDVRVRALMPNLTSNGRLDAVRCDFADLGEPCPAIAPARSMVTPEALGWLYVVESLMLNSGALLHQAAPLGMSASFGARHLSPPAEGRTARWRKLTSRLDTITLDQSQEHLLERSTRLAFHYARMRAEEDFAGA